MSKPDLNWTLNWKEWGLLAQHMSGSFTGARLERITVPERPEFAQKFLKGDYQLHFSNKRVLWLSLRNQHTALVETPRPLKACAQASLPPWVQHAAQLLGGMRLSHLHALPQDRVLRLDFGPVAEPEAASLVFSMIPARPVAWLLERGVIVQCSLGAEELGKAWAWSQPTTAPADPKVTHSFATREDSETFAHALLLDVAREARSQSVSALTRLAREKLKKLTKLRDHAETHARSARKSDEQDPALWATTLLIHSHESPTPQNGAYSLTTESGATVRIPVPTEWGVDQARDYLKLARYYSERARRMEKKNNDSQARLEQARAQIERLQPLLYRVLRTPDEDAVAQLEACLGISATQTPREISKRVEKGAPGRAFLSRDGWTILLGRNKNENLELTLRFARGNDLWLHLRAAASAHAVIPVPPGKSVPLETLLDAAHLVAHSSGRAASRAEVDYTLRKNVKRIPKSDEVTYTQEKTLTIQPDPARIQRLHGEHG